jgi:tetratricopeptide (TPR) repeat protein
MNIKDKIKLLLKEADLYKSQRLLSESKSKYLNAIELIQNSKKIQNSENLIGAITKKIHALDTGIIRWDKAEATPEVSSKVQDLIKNLFTGENQKDSDAVKALKSAITLAKFGQFKRAIEDFNRLIPISEVSSAAAKNSIRCIIEISSIEEAVEQYHKWVDKKVFPGEQDVAIKKFLQGLIDKKGLNIDIDSVGNSEKNGVGDDILSEYTAMEDEGDEDIIDITSVGVRFSHGPKNGEHCELDVSFQAGNMLSLIVSNKDQMLIDCLQVGVKLEDMDFYSPIAIFKGSGVVESNTRIGSGPKKGNYSLDIKIHSI